MLGEAGAPEEGAAEPGAGAEGAVIRGPIWAEAPQTAPNKPTLTATPVRARMTFTPKAHAFTTECCDRARAKASIEGKYRRQVSKASIEGKYRRARFAPGNGAKSVNAVGAGKPRDRGCAHRIDPHADRQLQKAPQHRFRRKPAAAVQRQDRQEGAAGASLAELGTSGVLRFSGFASGCRSPPRPVKDCPKKSSF